jgi:hypothetical protein
MERREEELIASLLDRDPELKKHYEEHLELERKLAAFHHKVHLSPEEEIEKKRLQKLKLLGKDRMMTILERYRQPGYKGTRS